MYVYLYMHSNNLKAMHKCGTKILASGIITSYRLADDLTPMKH